MTALPDAVIALLLCSLVALGAPIIFVYVRHEVRVQRLRILDQFERTMNPPVERGAEGRTRFDDDSTEAERGKALRLRRHFRETSSFEYVVEKYIEDLDWGETNPVPSGLAVARDRVDARLYTRLRHWWRIRSSWRILASSLPFIFLSALGFYVLLACHGPGAVEVLIGKSWAPVFLMGGAPNSADEGMLLENTLTVAGMAFLGAYVFSLGLLGRAVATFDLSPITFLRVAINLITAVVGVVVAYRAFPDIVPMARSVLDGPAAVKDIDTLPLPRLWILLAFAFGLVPDLIVNFIVGQAQDVMGAKITDTSLLKLTKSASLELIDGIDFFSRFRLQQAGLFEVQNLAVANPIMLFVETPFGIYQCIDWVAQAQLCSVVGPERFLALRRYNIRTIFDLERALLSRHSTSNLRRFVASLMLTSPPGKGEGGWTFWGLGRRSEEPGEVGGAAFGRAIAALLNEGDEGDDGKPLDRSIRHLAAIVTDDLHIHRLRDIWLLMHERLNPDYDALPDSLRPVDEAP